MKIGSRALRIGVAIATTGAFAGVASIAYAGENTSRQKGAGNYERDKPHPGLCGSLYFNDEDELENDRSSNISTVG